MQGSTIVENNNQTHLNLTTNNVHKAQACSTIILVNQILILRVNINGKGILLPHCCHFHVLQMMWRNVGMVIRMM